MRSCKQQEPHKQASATPCSRSETTPVLGEVAAGAARRLTRRTAYSPLRSSTSPSCIAWSSSPFSVPALAGGSKNRRSWPLETRKRATRTRVSGGGGGGGLRTIYAVLEHGVEGRLVHGRQRPHCRVSAAADGGSDGLG